MRTLFILPAITLLTLATAGQAQVEVHVRADRESFLLYEPIPLAIGIQNFTGREVTLANTGDRSWLEFVVTDAQGAMIDAAGKPNTSESLVLPAGRTVTRMVDLIPLFDLRQRGTYRVLARIQSGAVQAMSSAFSFNIIGGREIWRQSVGVRAAESTNDQVRTYSLQSHREGDYEFLYAGVQDEAHNLVYGMLRLGRSLAVGDPEARPDGAGHLHVLFCNGPHTFSHVHVDPQAHVVGRDLYSDLTTRPQLVTTSEGQVIVQGGEKIMPREPRLVSEEKEANPSPATATTPVKPHD